MDRLPVNIFGSKNIFAQDVDGQIHNDVDPNIVRNFPILKRFLRNDGSPKTLLHKYLFAGAVESLFIYLSLPFFRPFVAERLGDTDKMAVTKASVELFRDAQGPNTVLVAITQNPMVNLEKLRAKFAANELDVVTLYAKDTRDKLEQIDALSTGRKMLAGDIVPEALLAPSYNIEGVKTPNYHSIGTGKLVPLRGRGHSFGSHEHVRAFVSSYFNQRGTDVAHHTTKLRSMA